MKTFNVVLTKSYIVSINAESSEKASEFAQFFTGDISDISNVKDRANYNFEILEIDCKINEALEVSELNGKY